MELLSYTQLQVATMALKHVRVNHNSHLDGGPSQQVVRILDIYGVCKAKLADILIKRNGLLCC